MIAHPARSLAQQTPKKPPLGSSLGPNLSSPPPPSPEENTGTKAAELTAAILGSETPLTCSNLHSLDQDLSPLDLNSRLQRTGALSRDDLSSRGHQRRTYARVFFGLFTLGVGFHVAYMGREWDGEELERKRMTLENAPATRWGRTKTRFADMFDYFTDPVMAESLSPGALPHPQAQAPLDNLLVTPTQWDCQAIRIAVDYFLAYISQIYELVVYMTRSYQNLIVSAMRNLNDWKHLFLDVLI